MRNTTTMLLAALCVCGCYGYPSNDERYDDTIVATHYDSDADFASYQTFAVSPVVDFIDVAEDDPEVEPLPDALANPLIATVEAEMKKTGYQSVSEGDEPDLGIKISVSKGTVVGVAYSPYWYWYGYPYYYWGYYYPYDVSVSYAYNTGVIKVDMIDVGELPPPGESPIGDADGGVGVGDDAGVPPAPLRALWTGAVYGVLLEGTDIDKAQDGIEQAFKQSPYLGGAP